VRGLGEDLAQVLIRKQLRAKYSKKGTSASAVLCHLFLL
jgi:hypothetical protein